MGSPRLARSAGETKRSAKLETICEKKATNFGKSARVLLLAFGKVGEEKEILARPEKKLGKRYQGRGKTGGGGERRGGTLYDAGTAKK